MTMEAWLSICQKAAHKFTGFHIPLVRKRDNFYAKIEQERAENLEQ